MHIEKYEGGFISLLIAMAIGWWFVLAPIHILGLAAMIWVGGTLLANLYYRIFQ